MSHSTRDAILALRKDKQAMDVFETAETEDTASSRLSTAQLYSSLTSKSDKKKSEDVVQLDLKPSVAFAKFAGRIYDSKIDPAPNATSAPAALSKLTPLPSRQDGPTSFASAVSSPSPFEAPVDKFNRLKREIAQFSTDLALIAKSSPPQDDVGELAALLVRELKGLDDQLSGLVKSDGAARLMGDAEGDDAKCGDTLLSQMIAKLQQTTQPQASVTITAPPSPSPTASSEPALNPQLLSSLDRRLAALERTVGMPVGVLATPSPASSSASKSKARSSLSASPPPSSSSLVHTSYSSPYPDLHTAIMTLHRKLVLLDPARLDSLHRTLKTLTADLELLPLPQPLTDSARSSEMYDVLMRWDAWMAQLPVVVARLRGVRVLVDEAKGLGDRVRRLETEGEAMRKVLEEDRAALTQLSQGLPGNFQQMEKNLQAMQQRILTLQQKIDKLQK